MYFVFHIVVFSPCFSPSDSQWFENSEKFELIKLEIYPHLVTLKYKDFTSAFIILGGAVLDYLLQST